MHTCVPTGGITIGLLYFRQAAIASRCRTGYLQTTSNTRLPPSALRLPSFSRFACSGSTFSQPCGSPSSSWRTPSLRFPAVASTIVPRTVRHGSRIFSRCGLYTCFHSEWSQAGCDGELACARAAPAPEVTAGASTNAIGRAQRIVLFFRAGGALFLVQRIFPDLVAVRVFAPGVEAALSVDMLFAVMLRARRRIEEHAVAVRVPALHLAFENVVAVVILAHDFPIASLGSCHVPSFENSDPVKVQKTFNGASAPKAR